MGSNRLPGKVLMRINKQTILEFVISQLKNSKYIEKIVIATTTLSEDDVIVKLAKKLNIDYFRGNPKNVLDRYYKCAQQFSIDLIVRITSDNPLIDPTIVDSSIQTFNKNSYDYVTNCRQRTFPYGVEVEVFTFNVLERSWINAKKPSELEHVTPYIYNNSEKFKIYDLKNDIDLSNLRWTVDHKNDLELVQLLVKKIEKRPILMTDILELFSNEPDLININKNNIPNEGFLKSIKEDENYFKSINNNQ